MKFIAFILFLASFQTQACEAGKRTFIGTTAMKLIAALKMAGGKYTESEDETQVKFENVNLTCLRVNGDAYTDGLNRFACTEGPELAINNEANAKVLFDALDDAGIFWDRGMSKVHLQAKDVNCELNAVDYPVIYKCEMNAIWADECQP